MYLFCKGIVAVVSLCWWGAKATEATPIVRGGEARGTDTDAADEMRDGWVDSYFWKKEPTTEPSQSPSSKPSSCDMECSLLNCPCTTDMECRNIGNCGWTSCCGAPNGCDDRTNPINAKQGFCYEQICLAAGTQISLASGESKPIENITYEDVLKVWDFDNGVLSSALPLWIKRKETIEQSMLVHFNNGGSLRIIKNHRIFNEDLGRFEYPSVGSVTRTQYGDRVSVVSIELIEETVDYYNVVTHHHMNLFADGILTSLRYNNMYPISNMTFVKDQHKDRHVPRTASEFGPDIPFAFYSGLRLAEQPVTITTSDTQLYISRMLFKATEKSDEPHQPSQLKESV